jgi:hypothetical protein
VAKCNTCSNTERRSLGLDAPEQAALDRGIDHLTDLPAPYLGLDYEGGDSVMAEALTPGVRRYPEAADLLGPQAASGTGSPTSGALPAAALPPLPQPR